MDSARLIELVAKKRSPIKAGLVDAVMSQAVSDADKILRIEMIDLLPDTLPEPRPRPRVAKKPIVRPPPKRMSRVDPPPLVNPDLDEPDRVEHRRRHLGRPPAAGGLWRYLFREHRRIAEWGARTGALVPGLFPFTFKLSPEVLHFINAALKNEVLPVLQQNLSKILQKAWKSLEKFDYNLLAAVKPLCQVLAAVPPGGSRGPAAPWEAVLPAAMVFWTSVGLGLRTIDAWNAACTRLGVDDGIRLGGADSIRLLLEPRTDRVALPNVLRALLMLRTRRALDWAELLPRENGDYFAKDSFDCPREVQAEIDSAVAALQKQLQPIDHDYTEVRRIRYFVPQGRLLEEFDRDQDRSDKTVWCVKFLELASVFHPLLSGTVMLRGGESTVLFRDIAISSALTRLDVLHTQLVASQARDAELAAAVGRVVTNLGKLIVIQIRSRSQTADVLVRNPRIEEVTEPLPHELGVLETPTEWAGLTVIEALVKSARLCLLAGRLLGDTSLETTLEKEEPLRTRAHEFLVQLRRLANPAAIAETLAAWTPYLPDLSVLPGDAGAVSV